MNTEPPRDTLLGELVSRFPRVGRVEWVGLRPQRRASVNVVPRVLAISGQGLEGDHYASVGGKRQVTLIQWEHLSVIGALLGERAVDPARLRRNLCVRGINLWSTRDQLLRVGEALLEVSGPCDPCSRMEKEFGPGGYNIVRGHGGVTARVLCGGWIAVGDEVSWVGAAE